MAVHGRDRPLPGKIWEIHVALCGLLVASHSLSFPSPHAVVHQRMNRHSTTDRLWEINHDQEVAAR